MGNLKLKSKKKSKADVARIASVIKNVNDLISMGLLSVEKNAEVYVFPEILDGKDKTYHENFCKNLLIYYKLHSGLQPEQTRNTVLGVYNKTTSELLFQYSDHGGLAIRKAP